MVTRTISGILGGLLILTIIMFNQSVPFLINLFVAAICVLTTYEIYAALGIDKTFDLMIPSIIFSAVLPLFGRGRFWNISLYTYTLIVFFIIIFCRKRINFKDAVVVFAMTLLITFSLSRLIELRNYTSIYSDFYLLFALAIPWMSDTGAYFIGKFFGKHKLCPDVSPKKTIEGALGGTIISVIINLFICFIFSSFIFNGKVTFNYCNAFIIAFIGAVISIIGDLCFSMFKRSYRIKDFGNVIPGHGGVLDRFDSVIFVVPFVYFMVRHVSVLEVL